MAATPSTQHTLTEIWSDVLGVGPADRGDDFFDLGGHSLTAMVLLARIHSQFGVQLDIRTVFDSPTIVGMADAIQELIDQGAPPAADPIVPLGRDGYGYAMRMMQRNTEALAKQIEAIGRRGGIADSGIPTLEDACENGAWYCGPPEGFVDFLSELNSRYPGLEDVNAQSAMGTPEKVMIEQLEWFGKEVMPKMRMAEAAD